MLPTDPVVDRGCHDPRAAPPRAPCDARCAAGSARPAPGPREPTAGEPDPGPAGVPDGSSRQPRRDAEAPAGSRVAGVRPRGGPTGRRGPLGSIARQAAVPRRRRSRGVVTGADLPSHARLGGGPVRPQRSGVPLHPVTSSGPTA